MWESANTYRRLFRLFSASNRKGLGDAAPRGVVRDGKLEEHHSALGYAKLVHKHTSQQGGDKHTLDNVGRIVRYRVLASSGLHRGVACKHRSGPDCVQLLLCCSLDIHRVSNHYSQTSMGRNEAACLALEQVWVALVLV